MKKTLYSILLLISFIIFNVSTIFATPSPTLFINGESFCNVSLILKNNATFVPLRFCSEQLQSTVTWIPETQEILIKKNDISITFHLDDVKYTVNSSQHTLNTAPFLMDNTTYIPFRPLIESLGGVVLYNNEHKFINIYDTSSKSYDIYKSLGSTNITTNRFALLESPKKSFIDSDGGSRANTYIFPADTCSNYFFRYFSDEGTLYGIDYFEIHDGIAVQKWSRTQAGSSTALSSPSPILNYLGNGDDIKEQGVFPSLTETSFVGFYNTTMESDPDQIMNFTTIGNTVSLITTAGCSTPELTTPNKLIFSPFGSPYYLIEFSE